MTEALLEQHPIPTLDGAVPPAPLSTADTALPDLLRHTEHDWRGGLLIVLTRLTGWAFAAAAMVFASSAILGEMPLLQGLGWAALLGVASRLQFDLADHVRRFARWGWIGAMTEILFAMAAKLHVDFRQPEDAVGAAIGLLLELLCAWYLWERREDFDIDLGF